jgi:HlyD family secretion protein
MQRKSKLIVGLVIVAAAAAAGAWLFFRNDRNSAASYRLAVVEHGPMVSAVSTSGTLNAVITVQVGSQVSGQIKEMLADYNSEVAAGQVIARIDPETFEAKASQAEAELAVARANVGIQRAGVERAEKELANAEAALNSARAQTNKARVTLENARRNMERRLALYRSGAASESQADDARTAYNQAQAQLESTEADEHAAKSLVAGRQAAIKSARAQVEYALQQVRQKEAALHQAAVDLEHTFIRSPVDGVVIERAVDVGQTVAASLQAPKLFTIAQDLREMQVEADVDEADIGRIQLDQPALFTVDAFPGREFRGKVLKIRIAPRTVQNVVTYTVLISAENSDLRLLPGMTANIRIITDTRSDAVKVPNAALRFKPPAPDGAAVNPAAGPGSGRGAGADRAQPPAAGRAAAGPDAAPTFKGRVHVLDAKQRLVPLDVVLGINDGAFTELVRGDLTAGQEVVVGLAPAGAAGAARPTRRFGF